MLSRYKNAGLKWYASLVGMTLDDIIGTSLFMSTRKRYKETHFQKEVASQAYVHSDLSDTDQHVQTVSLLVLLL